MVDVNCVGPESLWAVEWMVNTSDYPHVWSGFLLWLLGGVWTLKFKFVYLHIGFSIPFLSKRHLSKCNPLLNCVFSGLLVMNGLKWMWCICCRKAFSTQTKCYSRQSTALTSMNTKGRCHRRRTLTQLGASCQTPSDSCTWVRGW